MSSLQRTIRRNILRNELQKNGRRKFNGRGGENVAITALGKKVYVEKARSVFAGLFSKNKKPDKVIHRPQNR